MSIGSFMALFHCMVRHGSARLVTARHGSFRVGLRFHWSFELYPRTYRTVCVQDRSKLGLGGARDSSLAAWLNTPGMWMAQSDLRCFPRQLICQRSWGPLHTPETAYPLFMAPKRVAKASVSNTACLDTCSGGTSARRNERSVHGLKVLWQPV